MPRLDRCPQFEPGLAGFTRTSTENLLIALATVKPAEVIAALRANLEAQDNAERPVEEGRGDDAD